MTPSDRKIWDAFYDSWFNKPMPLKLFPTEEPSMYQKLKSVAKLLTGNFVLMVNPEHRHEISKAAAGICPSNAPYMEFNIFGHPVWFDDSVTTGKILAVNQDIIKKRMRAEQAIQETDRLFEVFYEKLSSIKADHLVANGHLATYITEVV